MKFYVNEKLFSIHRKFYVNDEEGNSVYEISSKIISLGDKTTIKDNKENVVSYIEQKLFHLMPSYDVYIDNELVCNITKRFQIFKNDYKIDNGYRVDGNFMMLDFLVYDSKDNEIASITRKFFSIGDKYEISIKNKKDIPLALSIIVAIANDINRIQSSSANSN